MARVTATVGGAEVEVPVGLVSGAVSVALEFGDPDSGFLPREFVPALAAALGPPLHEARFAGVREERDLFELVTRARAAGCASLDVSGCSAFDGVALAEALLATRGPPLEALRVRGCTCLGDASAVVVEAALRTARGVDLPGLELDLGDVGIRSEEGARALGAALRCFGVSGTVSVLRLDGNPAFASPSAAAAVLRACADAAGSGLAVHDVSGVDADSPAVLAELGLPASLAGRGAPAVAAALRGEPPRPPDDADDPARLLRELALDDLVAAEPSSPPIARTPSAAAEASRPTALDTTGALSPEAVLSPGAVSAAVLAEAARKMAGEYRSLARAALEPLRREHAAAREAAARVRGLAAAASAGRGGLGLAAASQ